MTDNRFNIILSASDKATAVIKKVNDSFSRLTRPISEVNRATKSFAKEAGIDKIGKSLVEMGRAAGDVAGKITGMATPLAAITSFGSVAGMAALAVEWAKFGAEIPRTAATLGISQEQLQSWRGAAQIAGVSADALTGGMKSFGTALQDAFFGRNQMALSTLNRLNIGFSRTADGGFDTVKMLHQLSDAIRAQPDAHAQRTIASQFGLEELLPLLRQGGDAIDEFGRRWKATGAEMTPEQTETANNFRVSLVLLGGAMVGIGNNIALTLAQFQPWIDDLREGIAAHQGLSAAISSTTAVLGVLGVVGVPIIKNLTWLFRGLVAATLPMDFAVAAVAIAVYELYENWDLVWAKVKAVGTAMVSVARIASAVLSGDKSGLSAALADFGKAAVTLSTFTGSSSGAARAAAAGGAGALVGGSPAPVVAGAPVALPYGVDPQVWKQAVAASRAAGAPMGPEVNVTVDFNNAPPGMRARTEATGGAKATARINHAMPDGLAQ